MAKFDINILQNNQSNKISVQKNSTFVIINFINN
jgi:hypothetical protein